MGCDNIQWNPKIVVDPMGTGVVEGTDLDDDRVLYMPSFHHLRIYAFRGGPEYTVDLPHRLFAGSNSRSLQSGTHIVVTSRQMDVKQGGQIVFTKNDDGTRFTFDICICPVGIV
jgi:hypothetical protein